jgi:hypothetical protein
MLACLLLAAMLGGIAMANPDALHRSDRSEVARGGASHGGGTAIREASGHHDHDGSGGGPDDDDVSTGTVHTVEGCRAIVAHLQGDVGAGDHRGLAHAIEVVARNCRSHAAAPGLLRALDRLVANLERWQDRHGDGPRASDTSPGRGNGNGGDAPAQSGQEPAGHDGPSNGGGTAPTDPGGQGSAGAPQGGGNGSGQSG